MASTPHKKRKRDSDFPTSSVISVNTVETSPFPPVVASCRGIAFPSNISFRPYSRKAGDPKKPRLSYLLHAPASQIDYVATSADEEPDDVPRRYIGIFDPATSTVTLHAAAEVAITRSIKEQRQRDADVEQRGSALSYADARTALGKEFGTKKAQKALENREKNRIDHSGLGADVSSAIQAQVQENTRGMPTTAMLGSQMTEQRPVPKHNPDARSPAEAYARQDLIGDEEWEALDVSLWLKHRNARTPSEFINSRANVLLNSDDAKKFTRPLKIYRYLDYLMVFYKDQARRRGKLPQPAGMQKILGMAPQVVVEGFYSRFAEHSGDGKYQVSPALSQKLLFYLAVCCLMADGYDVDTYDLKTDLALQPKEIAEAFKGVGCVVREMASGQATALKLTKAEAVQHKRAVLTIPLKFPEPPRRRVAGRR